MYGCPYWILALVILCGPLRGQVDPAEVGADKPREVEIHALGNATFEIVGTDYRSVVFVEECSQQLITRIGGFFDLGQPFPQRILIKLVPEDRTTFAGDYQLTFERGGFVTLDFKWHEQLELEVLCYAMTQALLSRLAIYQHGPNAVADLPFWMVSGLATDFYLELRPAVINGFIREARAQTMPTLENLLARSSEQVPQGGERRLGYWFMRAVGDEFSNKSLMTAFLQRGLAGQDVRNIVYERVRDHAAEGASPDRVIEAWWQTVVESQLAATLSLFESLDESREWLELLNQYGLTLESGDRIDDLRDMWRHRARPEIREVIAARLKILSVRIRRINPAYLNAAQSTGVLLECLLDESSRQHDFVRRLTVHLSDYNDARKLHADIQSALERN